MGRGQMYMYKKKRKNWFRKERRKRRRYRKVEKKERAGSLLKFILNGREIKDRLIFFKQTF